MPSPRSDTVSRVLADELQDTTSPSNVADEPRAAPPSGAQVSEPTTQNIANVGDVVTRAGEALVPRSSQDIPAGAGLNVAPPLQPLPKRNPSFVGEPIKMPASTGLDVVRPTVSPLEASSRVYTNSPGGLATLRRYEWYTLSPLYAASGSCAVPGYPYEGVEPTSSLERFASSSKWLGRANAEGPPLCKDTLSYEWETFPRTDVSLSEVLAVVRPRLDLRRFQLLAERSVPEAVAPAWKTFFGRGHAYQVPEEIPCDRTFAFSVEEVAYVDKAARLLFGTIGPVSDVFPLSEIVGLHTHPCPTWYPDTRLELVRATASLMRMTGRSLCPHDWSSWRRLDNVETRVSRASSLAPGLTRESFPRQPDSVIGTFHPAGVHVLLPMVLTFFGYAAADPQHPSAVRFERIVAQEWTAHVLSAFMQEFVHDHRLLIPSSPCVELTK